MRYILLLLFLVSCKPEVSEEGLKIIEFEKVCIEGHLYFRRFGGQHGGSFGAIKLDDNGKPIRCSMETSKE